ncbi:MAG TPA: cobyrinate a,c-diamide synthase [Burkholderiaceae bacterium]|nr:cobyrinate a,c-diamide synthase [Burkholderiaceae bacterium]HQR71496.1 cobyrinate a,c-diamide synthase [Burkholderiaceae bacterium]
MYRLYIAAAHKSSGKTTVAIGLAAALRARGLEVQPFKKGPDYIDPLWLGAATGRGCYNLDPYMSSMTEIGAAFDVASAGAEVALVEGNMGLHDGISLDGSDSNAALARALDTAVVLVIDARGMTRTIAPLVLGLRAFDPGIRIAGVILNHVGGSRHESKLRAALEQYTNIPVFGALREDRSLVIEERHLGLRPATESDRAGDHIRHLADTVAAAVDLDALLASCGVPGATQPARTTAPAQGGGLRLGIARDRAFGFYYADDLDALQRAGARLVYFDALSDAQLPEIDALYLGGGFPEVLGAELAANRSLLASIRAAVQGGLPTYAECGGLMLLARAIVWNNVTYPMAGVIPADVVMCERPVGRGYVHLEETGDMPWPRRVASTVRAHEFHHSMLVNVDPGLRYAYRVRRGHGVDGEHDGIVIHNALASYAHLRSTGGNDWPARFIDFARAKTGTRTAARPLAGGGIG